MKSGFITVAGRPNVGKSTLINSIIGEKVSIVSQKPQTTRNTVRAIYNSDDCQMVFIDTPGIHKPKTRLGNYMVDSAKSSLKDVDAVLFVVEALYARPGKTDLEIIEKLKYIKAPVILIVNKIDLIKKDEILVVISNYSKLYDFAAIIPISAKNKEGIELIMDELDKYIPEGPQYFPEDMMTDRPEKFIVSEIIREKVLILLDKEVPHGIGVDIESFIEREDKEIIEIYAAVYCEKDSHKGIIIGKKGSMLNKIGSLAREDIEVLLNIKVFLKLFVKVRGDWRNKPNIMKNLGYR